MILAENSGGAGAGAPGRVDRRDGDCKVVFQVDFTYLIDWIGIIGSTIPGTEH